MPPLDTRPRVKDRVCFCSLGYPAMRVSPCWTHRASGVPFVPGRSERMNGFVFSHSARSLIPSANIYRAPPPCGHRHPTGKKTQ